MNNKKDEKLKYHPSFCGALLGTGLVWPALPIINQDVKSIISLKDK
jgi:hypothetical protein